MAVRINKAPSHNTTFVCLYATIYVCVCAFSSLKTVPGPVTLLQGTNLSSSRLNIRWNAPESGGPVQFYLVNVSTVSETIRTKQTTELFLDINNLSKFA